ncbi:MAG TPA: hypothetical protein VFQ81_12385 [Candidatus Limnocylindria bacterium]|nr:hypothetical protein [Candidatus Limnocylindria bacterium]
MRGRTATTIASASWSNSTRSTTACSTPSSLAHSVADRTPFPFSRIQPSTSRNRSRGTACSHIKASRHPRIGEKSLFLYAPTKERAKRMVGLLADYQYGSLDYFGEHGVEVIERDVGSAPTGQGNDRHDPDDPSDQHSGL